MDFLNELRSQFPQFDEQNGQQTDEKPGGSVRRGKFQLVERAAKLDTAGLDGEPFDLEAHPRNQVSRMGESSERRLEGTGEKDKSRSGQAPGEAQSDLRAEWLHRSRWSFQR